MKRKVMVFAVHPDDETLGAGGTLLKHLAAGDEVHWVIMTQMSGSVGIATEVMEKRIKEIELVKSAFKFKELHQLPFTTTKMDTYSIGEVVTEISKVVKKVQPEVIYIPFGNDIHTDHQIAFQALSGLTKQFRYPFIKEILCMEVLSETNFAISTQGNVFFPSVYVDVTPFLQKKLEIIDNFKGEILEHPFARSKRSIEALAVLRGSEAHVEYAEAFQLIKMVR